MFNSDLTSLNVIVIAIAAVVLLGLVGGCCCGKRLLGDALC
jgi:hypothetical protein